MTVLRTVEMPAALKGNEVALRCCGATLIFAEQNIRGIREISGQT